VLFGFGERELGFLGGRAAPRAARSPHPQRVFHTAEKTALPAR
jgi:hypothetical protein